MPTHPAFVWESRDEIRDFVGDIGFGALFVAPAQVAHVPVVWIDDATLAFHLGRGNSIARALDGASGLFSVLGPQAYVSPDWYGLGNNEVPTWNYVSADLAGRLTRIDDGDLLPHLDQLSHEHERRLAPKPEWTRAKMDAGRAEKIATGITGFRFHVESWHGLRKLNQNKPDGARLAAANALGSHPIADLMRSAK